MSSDSCLNCGQPFSPKQKFCSHCGQKRDIKRFTFKQLIYDFLQTIVNTERGIWRLLSGLALRPGQTAIEYIEGKRKTYFNPFTFLALCVAFMVLVNTWLDVYTGSGTATENQGLFEERIAAVQHFVQKYQNYAIALITPYFAVGLWLFFRKRKRNAAEIMVAYVLFAAFSFIPATLLISPLVSAYPNHKYWVLYLVVAEGMYIAWGFKTFFGYRTAGGYIKVLAALGLIGLVGVITLFLGVYIYASQG